MRTKKLAILIVVAIVGCNSTEDQLKESHKQATRAIENCDFDGAISCLTTAISIDPNDAWAYHSRGAVYGKKGDYDKAIEDSAEAIRIDPKFGGVSGGHICWKPGNGGNFGGGHT